MPTPVNPSENQSTYWINPEEAAETGRLLLQDRMITKEMGVTTQEEFDHLYEQVGTEIQDPTFRGMGFFLSVWGTKPERS